MEMKWDNQQPLTNDREDQGQTIENISKMKIGIRKMRKSGLVIGKLEIC